MKLTPEMKEIALQKSKEHGLVGNPEMLLDFLHDFFFALPKPEPVAWVRDNETPFGCIEWKCRTGKPLKDGDPLYAEPQDTAAIEQRVVEACAEWVRSGLHDDDPYIIARGLEDGAWRK